MVAMAGQGPAKGSTPAPPSSPQNQDRNSQTPLVDANPGGDLEAPRRKTKKRRADAGVTYRTINLSEGVSDPSKKTGRKKDCRAKSPKLRLEKLIVADYDRYREDPLEAAAEVCKTASNLLKKFKKEEEERFAELKVERDEALGQAKVARDALEEAEKKVNILRSSEAKMKKELQELKLAKEAADRKVEEFEGSVSKLEREVEDLKQESEASEKAKEEAEANVQMVAREGVRIAGEQFENTLELVQFCNPALVINRTVVDVNHVVLGDQVVKPGSKHDGTSLVIYQRPC